MFFIFALIAILIIFLNIILNSKIQVRILKLDISTRRERKIKDNFEIYIEVIVWNKTKIFGVDIKKIITKRKINSEKLIRDLKNAEEKLNKNIELENLLQSIKDLQIELKKLDLELEIGTKDAALTAISIGVLSSAIALALKKQTIEGRKFKIVPIYENQNILNMKLDCIFRINLIHYIYKNISRRRDKNERKPSNRRTYAYGNE